MLSRENLSAWRVAWFSGRDGGERETENSSSNCLVWSGNRRGRERCLGEGGLKVKSRGKKRDSENNCKLIALTAVREKRIVNEFEKITEFRPPRSGCDDAAPTRERACCKVQSKGGGSFRLRVCFLAFDCR